MRKRGRQQGPIAIMRKPVNSNATQGAPARPCRHFSHAMRRAEQHFNYIRTIPALSVPCLQGERFPPEKVQ
jgi:hypothetical protein